MGLISLDTSSIFVIMHYCCCYCCVFFTISSLYFLNLFIYSAIQAASV